MITNLLASLVVTLVTNIYTTDNAQRQWINDPCPDGIKFIGQFGVGVSCAAIHGHWGDVAVPATEKTDTITIKEVSTLEFDWNGVRQRIPSGEKVVSSKSITFRKSEEWKEIGNPVTLELRSRMSTNDASRIHSFLITNAAILGSVTITNTSIK